MAVTLNGIEKKVEGDKRVHILTVTFSTGSENVVTGLSYVEFAVLLGIGNEDTNASVTPNSTSQVENLSAPGTVHCQGMAAAQYQLECKGW